MSSTYWLFYNYNEWTQRNISIVDNYNIQGTLDSFFNNNKFGDAETANRMESYLNDLLRPKQGDATNGEALLKKIFSAFKKELMEEFKQTLPLQYRSLKLDASTMTITASQKGVKGLSAYKHDDLSSKLESADAFLKNVQCSIDDINKTKDEFFADKKEKEQIFNEIVAKVEAAQKMIKEARGQGIDDLNLINFSTENGKAFSLESIYTDIERSGLRVRKGSELKNALNPYKGTFFEYVLKYISNQATGKVRKEVRNFMKSLEGKNHITTKMNANLASDLEDAGISIPGFSSENAEITTTISKNDITLNMTLTDPATGINFPATIITASAKNYSNDKSQIEILNKGSFVRLLGNILGGNSYRNFLNAFFKAQGGPENLETGNDDRSNDLKKYYEIMKPAMYQYALVGGTISGGSGQHPAYLIENIGTKIHVTPMGQILQKAINKNIKINKLKNASVTFQTTGQGTGKIKNGDFQSTQNFEYIPDGYIKRQRDALKRLNSIKIKMRMSVKFDNKKS